MLLLLLNFWFPITPPSMMLRIVNTVNDNCTFTCRHFLPWPPYHPTQATTSMQPIFSSYEVGKRQLMSFLYSCFFFSFLCSITHALFQAQHHRSHHLKVTTENIIIHVSNLVLILIVNCLKIIIT